MKFGNWMNYIDSITKSLSSLSIRVGKSPEEISWEAGFEQWKEYTLRIRENKNTIYFIGNGASASMASHISADLSKNAFIHTEVFSDLSLLTAIANDCGYDQVFAEPLRRRMKKGDMLVAISSSGNSPNIVNACRVFNNLGGVVVTLSAMKEDNACRNAGALNFYVPADTYGMAESTHAAILHYWVDSMTACPLPVMPEISGNDQINIPDCIEELIHNVLYVK